MVQIRIERDDTGARVLNVWLWDGDDERVAWSCGLADLAEALRYAKALSAGRGVQFFDDIVIGA